MCLGVPMRIVEIHGDHLATAETFGVRRRISTALLVEDAKVGEWVMVHVGYALERLEYDEAMEILDLLAAVAKEDPQWQKPSA